MKKDIKKIHDKANKNANKKYLLRFKVNKKCLQTKHIIRKEPRKFKWDVIPGASGPLCCLHLLNRNIMPLLIT